MTDDLTALITTAQAAGLATVYYYATAMVANGRFTLLSYEGLRPQVNVNPASVAALVAACEAAGIGCEEMRPIVLPNVPRRCGNMDFVDVYAVPEDETAGD